MKERIERVKISEFRVESAPHQLKIFGLGSCVALTFYDPQKKLGGLAHILLPGPAPKNSGPPNPANSSKYADQAVVALFETMKAQGSVKENLVAKIAGGANMFQPPPGAEQEAPIKPGIGERNILAVRRQLVLLSIPIAAEDVGGSFGRTLVFDLATGDLIITNLRGERKVL